MLFYNGSALWNYRGPQGRGRLWAVGRGEDVRNVYLQSLTTPAVSRIFLSLFILLITEFAAHFSAHRTKACPFRSSLLTCGTLTCSARFLFINSVLPTKHLFDHESTMMSYSARQAKLGASSG